MKIETLPGKPILFADVAIGDTFMAENVSAIYMKVGSDISYRGAKLLPLHDNPGILPCNAVNLGTGYGAAINSNIMCYPVEATLVIAGCPVIQGGNPS